MDADLRQHDVEGQRPHYRRFDYFPAGPKGWNRNYLTAGGRVAEPLKNQDDWKPPCKPLRCVPYLALSPRRSRC